MKIKVVLVSILVLTLGSCRDPQSLDEYVTNEWHEYSFSPENVINEISIGNSNLFPLLETDNGNVNSPIFTEGLSLNDYQLIFHTLFSQIIKDDFSLYQTYAMELFRKCTNKTGMFDEFHISIFKKGVDDNETYRLEYFIKISSETSKIELRKSEYTHITSYWEPVFPLENKISINEVENIFHNYGARYVDYKDGLNCSVQFFYEKDPYWFVAVSKEGMKDNILELWINSQDGSFQKENPFQN